jgi:prophage regulatory protein
MQANKFKQVASSRAIRLPSVSNLTGMSRATIWRKIKEDSSFPKPFHLSASITVWKEQEIFDWIASKKAETLRGSQAAGIPGGGRPMNLNATATKQRWKTSQNGNRFLSFYGLKVTVFPNARGGWTVSVGRNAEPPTYPNHATESEARAAAEQEFIQLRASGHFKPPPEPTLREILKGVHSLKELGPQGHERYAAFLWKSHPIYNFPIDKAN